MDQNKIKQLILDRLEEGIIVLDADLAITFYKPASTEITGFDHEDAVGKSLFEVFPHLDKDSSTFYKAMTTGKPVIDQVQNYVNYKGKSVSILSTTIPVFEDRELVGAFEIFKDLTTVRELSEKVLMLQNELYTKGDGHKALNGTQYTISDIVGESAALLELKNKAKKVANSNSPVFVYGETGTGKELIVQAMHNLSSRRGKPFIAQNCAALPENLLESILFGTAQGSFTGAKDRPGLFELADGGTLFLDEINSMNLELQSKLLRVIQDGVIRRIGGSDTKKVNVRIIAASNMDPNMMLEQNIIRKDLFYRLNVIYLYVPSLRERKEDIPILTNYFIDVFNRKMNKDIKGVTGEVLDRFFNGDWPGNVRELENTIESAMNFTDGDYIGLPDLQYYSILRQTSAFKGKESPEIPKGLGLKDAVGEYEKSVIISAIDEAGGNRAKAARMLKIPKQTLHGKLKRLGIKSRGEERE
ncbi:sigma-54 interaction domain-containing protein [Lutispora saccharofermentans]|uniref:Sigma 54-interacting transcriptional regulator n=1 Tax=Lutispora saccharofermentans TaxID=3024236 RepID=A0ABT1NDA6_9FIRM|nr:sigma 54-interacting transcriptional regulator [Lutispora saccharofermentans]MCQ1529258.1 sigma 54-interacting transcriptional regulator [Lutispora saccharofermentans]